MAYWIELTPLAVSNLHSLRVYDQRRIVDTIERQLKHQPTVETRNRKMLPALVPDFEHRQPAWELRVGNYRVFYDVDDSSSIVYVRTIRHKEHGQTTGEITHDKSER
jgi:mRNA-degrading endonuclease RelE of RelBE toxin-antitoxin system